MDFELGQTYDGYQFLELLRNSQDATEYRVHNMIAQRQEVLKILPAVIRDDQDGAGGFLREARILARLTHPHIIGFYTAQPIDGRMALTTEWSGFQPLTARLAAGPLPWREALDGAAQLLSALACLHERSVVHLDITPDNILCSSDGAWKLANFAMARVVNGAPLHGAGAVTGSPRYISPEQVKGGVLDYRSDLYSFAAVLFEMLCGRPPFDSKSQFELMLAHVTWVAQAPSQYNPSLPQALDEVILKALAKDPAERHASAAEFAAELASRTIGLNGRPGHAHVAEDAGAAMSVAAVSAEPEEVSEAVGGAELGEAETVAAAPIEITVTLAEARELLAVDVAEVVESNAAEDAEIVLAVAVDESAARIVPASEAPELLVDAAVVAVAAATSEDTEPVVAVAVDEPLVVTDTSGRTLADARGSDQSHDRSGAEPVEQSAPPSEAPELLVDAAVAAVAAATLENAEPVLAVAMIEPLATTDTSGRTLADARGSDQSHDRSGVEPVEQSAPSEAPELLVDAAVAAATSEDAEPVLAVAMIEPIATTDTSGRTLADARGSDQSHDRSGVEPFEQSAPPSEAPELLVDAAVVAVAAATLENAEPVLAAAVIERVETPDVSERPFADGRGSDQSHDREGVEPTEQSAPAEVRPLVAAAVIERVETPDVSERPLADRRGSDQSHDRKGVGHRKNTASHGHRTKRGEPVIAVAVDEPVGTALPDAHELRADAVVEPVVATTPEDAFADLAASVLAGAPPPSETLALSADAVVEPVAATTLQQAPSADAVEPVVEPVLADAVAGAVAATVAVDEPVAPTAPPSETLALSTEVVTEPIAAITADTVEPVPGVAVAEPAPVSTELVEAGQLDAVEAAAPPPPAGEADRSVQANLWAAAAIVAQAAAVAPGPVREPVTIVPVPAPAPAAAAPSPAPSFEAPMPFPVPALVAASTRVGPDSAHWIMLGSSAAFLAIVLIAIFVALR